LSTLDLAASLSRALDARTPDLARLDNYYRGTQPLAYLSREASEALGGRLRSFAVNYPRLVVDSIAERLTVTGFRTEGPDSEPDADIWRIWRVNGLEEASAQAHTEALALGSAFVMVWAGPDSRTPRVTVESASQVSVVRDPASREILAAGKRWTDAGRAYLNVYERDIITRYVSRATVAAGGTIPADGWEVRDTLDNPLGVVPVVPIVNRGRLLDVDGVSQMEDVLGVTDALNKVLSDALVSSEFYARPRRWVTGLEVMEDDDGNAINPFSNEAGRLWQSENPETKFGQFDGARLDGYSDTVATLTQQIGALSGLPPHYLGLFGDQPASADAIRSAEASLVATATARQRSFGAAWADVARLVIAVRDGVDPASVDVETVWESAETRTPAQAADAAAKLASIGVPLVSVLESTLGYSPAQIDRVRQLKRAESLDTAAAQVVAGLGAA